MIRDKASSSRERRAHRVDPGRGRPRGHLARGRRHGGKASRAATTSRRRAGGVVGDGHDRRRDDERQRGPRRVDGRRALAPERRRVRQPQVDGREPRGPARRRGPSRARDGADRARVVAEDDARPPQRRQDQGARRLELAREARGTPARDAPRRRLVVGPPVWKSNFGRPIDAIPNSLFDFHTEVNPPPSGATAPPK